MGTNGYTAPEVLKGEHYGTPADVFSFAIVMSEILALRAPYSDIMRGGGKDGDGQPMSWDQVVALTHKQDVTLRPTLPDDMDNETRALVQSCWQADPALRPSFSVILVRLDGLHRVLEREGSSRSINRDKDVEAMRLLFRSVNDLIWLFRGSALDTDQALALIDAGVQISAADETLRKILAKTKGLDGIKSLGWLMFGGFEDGAEIIPEPLLDEDIVCNATRHFGVITMHFAVRPPTKRVQWRVADTKEFDALAVALSEMGKGEVSEQSEALSKAVKESKEEAKARRRKMMRRKRPPRSGGARPEKNKEVTTFMKAAKFVRGMGAGKIHPSTKIALFGLRMQALHGNAPAEGDADAAEAALTNLRGLKGSALALQQLKVESWRSCKDKDRKEAMLEYVELVTSIAPQWRVATVLAGHESVKDDKPRKMVWVLKIDCKERGQKEIEALAAASAQPTLRSTTSQKFSFLSSRFLATSVEVLQASNDASARLWNDESVEQKGLERKSESGDGEEMPVDPFIATIATEFTLEDCIIDKTVHKTIQEQRSFYGKEMREMARKEDGWKLYGKTDSPLVDVHNQLEIYERDVEWSSSKQMRTVYVTQLGVEQVLESMIHDLEDSIVASAKAEGVSKALTQAAGENVYPFALVGLGWGTWLQYRVLRCPWPLSSRDYFIVQDYVLEGRGGRDPWLWTINHDVQHPSVPAREGFVRLSIMKQGLVGEANARGETRLTWLTNVSMGGSLPSSFSALLMVKMMALPIHIVKEAQAFIGRDTKSAFLPIMTESEDPFVANMPTDLTIDDCLVDKNKHPNLVAQRAYFQERMLDMAQAGSDDEKGWTFLSKTKMKGFSPEQQLDVYERAVPWSQVKQMRSVEETRFSCDQVFDFLLFDFGSAS